MRKGLVAQGVLMMPSTPLIPYSWGMERTQRGFAPLHDPVGEWVKRSLRVMRGHPQTPGLPQADTVTGQACTERIARGRDPPFCHSRGSGNPGVGLPSRMRNPLRYQHRYSTPLDPPLLGDGRRRRGASPLCTPLRTLSRVSDRQPNAWLPPYGHELDSTPEPRRCGDSGSPPASERPPVSHRSRPATSTGVSIWARPGTAPAWSRWSRSPG